MLSEILGWGIISVVIPVLLGVGVTVVNTRDADDLYIAKSCFVAAGLIGVVKFVQVALRDGNWDTYPLFAAGVTGCLWFCLEASRYVERKKQSKPYLVGRIICVHTETYANHQMFNIGPPVPVDCVISLNVSVTSDSVMAAMAIGFKLSVTVNKHVWLADEKPVDNCYLRQYIRNVGGGPRYRTNWKPLTAFPLNTEITRTTHQSGWLRFVIGSIKNFRVDETVRLKLTVFDHRNEPHEIYDGPITQLDDCGRIVEGERPSSDEF